MRLRAIAVVLMLAAGLVVAGPVPKAEAAGLGASAAGNLGAVYVRPSNANQVLDVYLYNGCTASVKLKPLQFTTNAKLTKADVLANTPCGTVSVHWDATGQPLEPDDDPVAVFRRAWATGTIGGKAFSNTSLVWASIAVYAT